LVPVLVLNILKVPVPELVLDILKVLVSELVLDILKVPVPGLKYVKSGPMLLCMYQQY